MVLKCVAKYNPPPSIHLDVELSGAVLGAPVLAKQLADEHGVRTMRQLIEFDLSRLAGQGLYPSVGRAKLAETLFLYGLSSNVHGTEMNLAIDGETVPIYDVLSAFHPSVRQRFLAPLITAGLAFSETGEPITVAVFRILFASTRVHEEDVDAFIEIATQLASGERVAKPRLQVLPDALILGGDSGDPRASKVHPQRNSEASGSETLLAGFIPWPSIATP